MRRILLRFLRVGRLTTERTRTILSHWHEGRFKMRGTQVQDSLALSSILKIV